jgi:hypothetical protein
VGTTFISQNVLRTTLLLSSLKANCLRFSTTVCDTQFTLIFFLFFGLMFNLRRTTRAEPEDHLWSADHSLGNAVLSRVYILHYSLFSKPPVSYMTYISNVCDQKDFTVMKETNKAIKQIHPLTQLSKYFQRGLSITSPLTSMEFLLFHSSPNRL